MPTLSRRSLNPRKSLTAAAVWLVSLLAATFSIGAALWIGSMARDSVLQQQVRQLALETDELASDLNQALSSRLGAVRAAAAILRSGGVDDSPTADTLRTVFDELQLTYPEFDWIALADADGTVVAANAGLDEGSDVSTTAWHVEGSKGPWIGDVQAASAFGDTRPNGGQRFFDLAAPVRDRGGRVIGVVAAHLSWRWASNYAQRLGRTLDPLHAAEALVLGKDLNVLVGPDGLRGRRWPGLPTHLAGLADAVVAAGRDRPTGLAPAAERLPDGQVVLLARAAVDASTELKALGWQVQLSEPETQVLQAPDALRWRIVMVAVGLGLAAALLGAWGAQRLTRRVVKLTRSVEATGRDAGQPLRSPGGDDEVTRLAAAFESVLADLRRERSELQSLTAELEERVAQRTREIERLAAESRHAALVRERLGLARDLHDTLAHSMMAMLSQIRLLRKLQVHDPSAVAAELAEAEQAAHEGLRQARAAITQLRFNAVRDVGLGAALADAARRFADRTGLVVDCQSDASAAALADDRAETLFRMTEEALRNVERHAAAGRVDIALGCGEPGSLELSITDDGIGFDPSLPHPGHYGLVGLKEQAQLIGAEVEIRSRPGQGCSLSFRLRDVAACA